jgi:threonyl-tRNA synthetase
LIEHFAGAFPVWLAPVQAVVLPIAERHAEFGAEVRKELLAAGIRVELDAASETLNKRIRQAQMKKVPYMLIAGDREVEEGQVSIRLRSGENLDALSVADAVAMMTEKVAQKAEV